MRPSVENRVAIVHHWLVTMRGGERVFEALASLFPSADLFTLVCDKSRIPASLGGRDIQSSLLQYLPNASRWYRYYLPLFPFATSRLNLAGYDLIVSSDAATVKGVRGGSAPHVCYCHTPMRYVWHGYATYHQAAGPIGRQALRAFRNSLCRWDYEAAQGVTQFVANSRNVQKRIMESYGRDSVVIYPPVDTESFSPGSDGPPAGESYLVVSQLVPYKRVDLLVDAFSRCGKPLTVIGDGPERRRLEGRAAANIRFLGSQPDAAVVRAMRQSSALMFAGEEDFGIVMAEAQACGTPVIALGRGGAAEIVRTGVTGILFAEESAECIIDALDRFDRTAFDPVVVRESALRFGRERFRREFSGLITKTAGRRFVGHLGPTPESGVPTCS